LNATLDHLPVLIRHEIARFNAGTLPETELSPAARATILAIGAQEREARQQVEQGKADALAEQKAVAEAARSARIEAQPLIVALEAVARALKSNPLYRRPGFTGAHLSDGGLSIAVADLEECLTVLRQGEDEAR
jgi:hypothetical protein